MIKWITGIFLVHMIFFFHCSQKINFIREISGENIPVPEFSRDAEGNDLGLLTVDLLFRDFPEFREWKEQYHPDQRILEKIRGINPPVSVLIVLGTWCPDSRKHVGEFLKIVEEAGLSWEIVLVGTDRKIQYPQQIIREFDVTRVPTFYFYSSKQFIGKIVEHPQTTMEQDILGIIQFKSGGNL